MRVTPTGTAVWAHRTVDCPPDCIQKDFHRPPPMGISAGARKGVTDFYAKEAKRLGYVARSALKLSEIQAKFGVIRRGGLVLDLGCHPGAWLQVACQALGPPPPGPPSATARGGGGSDGGVVLGVDLRETETAGMRHVDERVVAMQGDVFDLNENAVRNLEPVRRISEWNARRREGASVGAGEDPAPRGNPERRPTRRLFTTILSDMAPSTSGNAASDAALSYELAEAAVRLALGPGVLDVVDDGNDGDGEEEERWERSDSRGDAGGGSPGKGEGGSEERGLLRKGGNLVIKLLEGPGGGRHDLQTMCKPAFESFKWYRPKATRRESKEVFLIGMGRREYSCASLAGW